MAQEPSKVDVVIANHPSFVVDADLETVKTPSALLKGDQDVSRCAPYYPDHSELTIRICAPTMP